MFRLLGATELEEQVYRQLINRVSATVTDLAEQLREPASAVAEAVADLCTSGLATRAAGDPPRFVAAAPDTAVASLLLRRQNEIIEARRDLEDLVRAYRDGRRASSPNDVIEIVTGHETLGERVRQLHRGAQREYIGFIRPPFKATTFERAESVGNPQVLYRVLYDQQMLEIPSFISTITRGAAPNEELRVHPALPMKLMIADRSTALLPLGSDASDDTPSALIVHASGLLSALLALFELCWAAGTPLHVGDGEAANGALASDDRMILSLLLTGAADETIARQLDISARTVQRRINAMIAIAGVKTRVQLAWHAATHNWV